MHEYELQGKAMCMYQRKWKASLCVLLVVELDNSD